MVQANTPDNMTTPQETLKLYSNECLALLDQVVERCNEKPVKEESPLGNYEFFEANGSDMFYGKEDSDSDSEAESDTSKGSSAVRGNEDNNDNHEQHVDDDKDNHITSVSTVIQGPDSPTPSRTKIPSQRNPNKQSNTRQFEQQVQQHSQHLNRHTIPLDDPIGSHGDPNQPRSQRALFISTTLCSPSLTGTRDLARALQTQPLIIFLLRSGRFAAAVYQQDTCLQHTSSTRYTVRKGQGKAQSSQDAQRRPKSMGSQLRRAGEQALKQDVQQTLEKWKQYIDAAALILVAAPKTMRATLFETLDKKDSRLRHIPLDVGRPTMEATQIVQQVMMTVWVGEWDPKSVNESHIETTNSNQLPPIVKENANTPSTTSVPPEPEILPLTDLHMAARDANLPRLLELLHEAQQGLLPLLPNVVNAAAGYDFMTPLHFASEAQADACISALLIQGRADPTRLDARRRVPYFLATVDKTREAFRTARAVLGEDACDWEAAKVGPPLTEQEIELRKEKEAEKKRRKKAKQKEKKAKDKAHEDEMEQRRQEQLLQQQKDEEAKRIRDALLPKRADNVCDFCQTEVKGRKRQQMLQRLDYKYCSTDCVQKHKRELMAKAAMERFQ